MNRFFFNTILLILPVFIVAQKPYPADVTSLLGSVGRNKTELVKTINYFQKKNDSLQLRALYFLLANMSIHQSVNYYWVDNNGKAVSFNELDYPDLARSVKAFDAIKARTNSIHPQPIVYKDADTITAAYLIDNIEKAFTAWKQPQAKQLSFSDFCEYLLPYRISVEPLQNWRGIYTSRFGWVKETAKGKPIENTIDFFGTDLRSWFTNTFNSETRKEPLPRLGALQLLHRKKGPCEDIADLEVFRLRSQGIAASVDVVPVWATSSGAHFLNAVILPGQKTLHYDAINKSPVGSYRLAREPAKVLRLTYSKQHGTLASIEPQLNIPPGILRAYNYKDVTAEYWDCRDLVANLFATKGTEKTVYACVFNYFNWKPGWWGIKNNNTALFTKMASGAVYLPMYYRQGKMVPAGYPVALGYEHTLQLAPDTLHTHIIHLPEQDKYLVYKSAKKYSLFYWNNNWRLLATQTANASTREMVFNKVPQNALLLLVPENSEHKERPFMVTETGQRIWW